MRTIRYATKDFDARILAFDIAREIYLWFGYDEGKIPYALTEGDTLMIDPEEIKAL